MKILIRLILNIAAIALAAYLLPGIAVAGLKSLLLFALVLGLINLTLKPVLKILTLPLNLLTLGLFSLVLNALLIELAAHLVPGFTVASFLYALLFGVVLALVHFVLKIVE